MRLWFINSHEILFVLPRSNMGIISTVEAVIELPERFPAGSLKTKKSHTYEATQWALKEKVTEITNAPVVVYIWILHCSQQQEHIQ
jgi:hypothetical protein